jgi:regulator of nucleoside diphosphate kinase
MSQSPSIVVTDRNLEALVGLLSAHRRSREIDALEAEIERAQVVEADAIDCNIVTMNSRVCFQDEDSGERQEITLVYPHEADVSANRISVLAPVGAALLGLAVGQVIAWPVPSGLPRRLRIIAVPYQPEAAAGAAVVRESARPESWTCT